MESCIGLMLVAREGMMGAIVGKNMIYDFGLILCQTSRSCIRLKACLTTSNNW